MEIQWQRQWGWKGRVDYTRRPVSSAELRAAAVLRHCIKAGKPGSGKSTSGLTDIQRDIGKLFLLAEDIHGQFSDGAVAVNAANERHIEILDLNTPDRLFPVNLQTWSRSALPGQCIHENESSFDRLITMIAGEREINPLTMAFHGQGWRLARDVMTHRHQPTDTLQLWHVFRPGREQSELLQTCWDTKAVDQVQQICELRSDVQRQQIIGPFQRLTDPFLASLFVQALLSRPGVPWLTWMEQRKSVIVRATMKTPETLYRPVMAALRHLTVTTAMEYLAETERPLPAQIHCDEAARLGIGPTEAALMAQCRKAGVGYTLYLQRVPREPHFQDVLAQIERLEIYPQANVAEAEAWAREIVAFLYDSAKPKRVERHEKVLNRGMRREEVTVRSPRYDKRGNKVGETESTHFLSEPDLERVVDEHVVDQRHDELVQDWVRVIRKMTTGQRLVIDGTAVTTAPEPSPLPKQHFKTDAARQRYVREATQRIQAREHYFTFDFDALMEPEQELHDEPEGEEVWTTKDSTDDAAGRLARGEI